MADRVVDSFCSLLAEMVRQSREELAGLVGRAVQLEDRLARLERQPDVDRAELQRVREELAAVDGRLDDRRERLRVLEVEYNFARNPVLG
jgi:phage shock protein A